MSGEFSVATARAQFPSLAIRDRGVARVYLDNPAGTQVPNKVIERSVDCLTSTNANLGGHFASSVAATALVDEAHQACADFYNARSAAEIVFGQNMTSLTLYFSRCLGRRFQSGDEIVVTRMDHDANIAPWLLLAEDLGLTIRWMEFDPERYEFPADALTKVLSTRTRLVALGMASNCTGTVNDVAHFAKQARAAGALVFVDAVQSAPHLAIDVQALGADVLVSSAYKWFGPHQGILWAREDLLEDTFAYKVRPAGNELPHKFETGTLSHEGMAGTLAAIEYLESYGAGSTRRRRIVAAWEALVAYERRLTSHLIQTLQQFKGLTIRGLTDPGAMQRRVPTVSFTLEGFAPDALAREFARDNIFVWSGHNYAIEPVAAMGLMESGGVLRVGLAHYNTVAEIDALARSLQRIIRERS